MVMTCANRAISAPLSIWNDHQDAMSVRDAGWIQLYCADNQEAIDTRIQAYRIAERTELPVMVCVDGFTLTHTPEPLSLPTQEQVDGFLPPFQFSRALDPRQPISMGTLVSPDYYPEARHSHHQALLNAQQEIIAADREWAAVSGRHGGGLLKIEGPDDAEIAILSMGSIMGTLADAHVQDPARDQVKLIHLRCFRPFPTDTLREVCAGLKHLVVLERALSPGGGGAFDIGFQALSGMLERGHDVLYVCFDNEAYMNTGIQRSSSTPHAAMTTTSPPGKHRMGKRHLKKDIISIVASHHIPYAATATVSYPSDLRQKVRRALSIEGPTFLVIHSPCPLGWGHDGALSIEVGRLAIQTGLMPLIELERGVLTGAMPIREPRPVGDYLKLQKRFAHLFADNPDAHAELEHFQALADHNIEKFGLRGLDKQPQDSEGADTVQRGGMHYA